jgi:hypothetical protein
LLLARLRMTQIDARLAGAADSTRFHRGCAGEAEHGESCARGVDQAAAFERDQRLGSFNSGQTRSATERGRIDVARIARQAEQRVENAIGGVLAHDRIMQVALKACPVSGVQIFQWSGGLLKSLRISRDVRSPK